jgi:hypothetical protein
MRTLSVTDAVLRRKWLRRCRNGLVVCGDGMTEGSDTGRVMLTVEWSAVRWDLIRSLSGTAVALAVIAGALLNPQLGIATPEHDQPVAPLPPISTPLTTGVPSVPSSPG